MLVHFPVACWSLAVIADFASLSLGRMAWQWSGPLFIVGCVTAFAAMLAGLVDFVRFSDTLVVPGAYFHMAAMVAALLLFCIRLLQGPYGLEPVAPSTAALVIDACGFIALVIGGWFGGQMVYGAD